MDLRWRDINDRKKRYRSKKNLIFIPLFYVKNGRIKGENKFQIFIL